MTASDGSAAVPLRAPESAELTTKRSRLRAELPRHLQRMESALHFARGALDGPDPEACLGYLGVLDERLQEVLRDFR